MAIQKSELWGTPLARLDVLDFVFLMTRLTRRVWLRVCFTTSSVALSDWATKSATQRPALGPQLVVGTVSRPLYSQDNLSNAIEARI